LHIKANEISANYEIIASGGVSKLEDLSALKGLNLQNLSGVIVGKALYEKCFELKDAIKLLNT